MENLQLKKYEDLLVKNGLKKTVARIQVLEILSNRNSATSQPYLENLVGKEIDRVTLYRILKVFEEKGIIHRVIDNQGTANYAICSGACSANHHQDGHIHFNCSRCLRMYCMDEVEIPALNLPADFKVEQVNLIVSGICTHCQNSN